MQSPYGYWLPPDLSTHGATIDWVINFLHVFILIFFAGWAIYLLYVLVRFRNASEPAEPRRFRLPLAVEIGVVMMEIALIAFVSMPAWSRMRNDFPDDARTIHLRVIAQQYQWTIHYPGKDGVFGMTRPELVDDANFVGLDPQDPAGKDDIISLSHLYVPEKRPVVIELTSVDVVHSFSIPVLRVKQDVVPGMPSRVWFEATRTGDGFEIGCAQLCGAGHTNMRGFVHIETNEKFEAWLAERAAEKAT